MRKYYLRATTPDGQSHVFQVTASHVVGRQASSETLNKFSIAGDRTLSRNQFEVTLENGQLRVTPYLSSRNETCFQGILKPGGDFMAARMRRNGGNMKAAVADYLTLRKKANMLSA